jgi:diaminopimelate epimerase
MAMAPLEFYKMNGSGNDFILVDNRDFVISRAVMPQMAKALCRPKLSVGADGMIFVENSPRADFVWRFYNADGSEAEMCGNGGRCAARFAFLLGIAGSSMVFETLAGLIRAEVMGDRVKLQMTGPKDLALDYMVEVDGVAWTLSSVNTGVPHAVVPVRDLEGADVRGLGGKLRFHPRFQPAGTNVNFTRALGPGEIAVRTYERGVEDETLACGTGSVASALVAAAMDPGLASPVAVRTRSGEILTIHFTREGEGFTGVFLEGDARFVYKAELGPDAE